MVVERSKNRKALGKGLGALIPAASSTAPDRGAGARDYLLCPIERIHPQPGQPRQHFKGDSLNELVESIREKGIIQPLIVRRNGSDYELIAGERRWRASQLAGLKELPIVVKDVSAIEAFELALVENIQREDLNPVEEAEAFGRLIDEHGYTQAEVAGVIGRDRSTISNSLRLLGLPHEIKGMLVEGSLAEGHARAVLQAGAPAKMIALARQVAAKELSVRETERRARALSSGAGVAAAKAAATETPEVRHLVEKLQRSVGAKVKLVDRKGKGRIEINYTSYDELDGILNKILR